MVEVTCRTIQGRFLLKPSSELRSIIVGVLARAQRLYLVEIHAFVFLSNHYHLLMSVENTRQMARFMNYVNSNLAREAGRLHQWNEKFWGRRYQAIVVSEEEVAQVNRLRYLLSHGCKEGLVSRPEDWPGAQCVEALLSGKELEGLWFDRTRECAARIGGDRPVRLRFVTQETVLLSPLPCWKHLSEDSYRKHIQSLVKEIVTETAMHHERNGTRPLGARAISEQHPKDRPAKLKKALAPSFHAATRKARGELEEAYRWFLRSYRRAARLLAAGDRRARFPEGSFPPPLPFVEWTNGLTPG